MHTILVIEDDPDILDNICDLLDGEGFNAIGVTNGLEGIHEALVSIPDIIISDVMMPEVDGYGVIEEIRKHPSTATIPFIFLTAMADLKDHRKGMNTGADDYLTKPFRAEDLLHTIQIRLDKQAMITRTAEDKMEELRSNISRMIPHEFRTPLLAIIGFSQILIEDLDELPAEQIKEMLNDIYNAGGRLEELTEKYSLLTDLELLKTDHQKVIALRNQSCTDAPFLIEQAVKLIAKKHQRTEDVILSIEPGIIQMPSHYFETVIKEIVENTFKFSSPGSPVTITTVTKYNHYHLEIKDCGIGMNKNQINAINLFTQFDRHIYEQQGLGMGLALVSQIADLFISDLQIESTQNEGTTIMIRIPNMPIKVPARPISM